MDDAQREVRPGLLRVMGAAGEFVFKGASLATPTDALSVGLEGGQFAAGKLNEIAERRRKALQALSKAEQNSKQKHSKADSSKPESPQNRKDTPQASEPGVDWSTSIAGQWNGSVSVSEKADRSDEVVASAGFEATHCGGPIFDCKIWVENDPEAPVEKFEVRHVGKGRYVGKLNREYIESDMDFEETVSAVVDLRRKGSLIQGEITMKTSRRFGKKIKHYDSVMKLEFTR